MTPKPSKPPQGETRSNRPESDLENGILRGKTIARRFESPDGYTVLVGKSARDNDTLTIKVGRPDDIWLHVAAQSGSHVLIRNPERLDRLPKATLEYAAGLAAGYSGAKGGGQVAVHYCQIKDVSKRKGSPAGQVNLKRYKTLHARPVRE